MDSERVAIDQLNDHDLHNIAILLASKLNTAQVCELNTSIRQFNLDTSVRQLPLNSNHTTYCS